jgi:hypothetical protein
LNPGRRPVAGVLALVFLAGGFGVAVSVMVWKREGWEALGAVFVAFFAVGVGAGLAAAAAAVALMRAERWMLLHATVLALGLVLAVWIGQLFLTEPPAPG